MSATTKLKPRGRPFPKGIGGNPSGLPSVPKPPKTPEQKAVEVDVRRYSRLQGRDAVDKLVEVMSGRITLEPENEGEKPVRLTVGPNTQLAAAIALLDRGYGRPPQAVEISGKDGGPVVTETRALDIIRSRLASMRERIEDGDGPSRLN